MVKINEAKALVYPLLPSIFRQYKSLGFKYFFIEDRLKHELICCHPKLVEDARKELNIVRTAEDFSEISEDDYKKIVRPFIEHSALATDAKLY